MDTNKEPWSKRIWYAEALFIFILFWIVRIVMVMVILIIISLVITAAISISLKASESKTVKPITTQKSSYSFTDRLNGNSKDIKYEEELYNRLTIKLSESESKPIQPNVQVDLSQEQTQAYADWLESDFRVKYVTYEGNQYPVQMKSLKLQNKNIRSITDIQGLDKLFQLKKLDLSHNQITSMKGIDHLVNLRVLKLSDNKIHEIGYIQNLRKLKKVYLDKNQLEELNSSDFAGNLNYINIARNPIKEFNIYSRETYKKIHFGPMKWFPKEKIKRLKKFIRQGGSKSDGTINGGFHTFLAGLAIWLVITFLLACVINLMIWGAVTNFLKVQLDFWVVLFTSEWSAILFFGAGILSAIAIIYIYIEGL